MTVKGLKPGVGQNVAVCIYMYPLLASGKCAFLVSTFPVRSSSHALRIFFKHNYGLCNRVRGELDFYLSDLVSRVWP